MIVLGGRNFNVFTPLKNEVEKNEYLAKNVNFDEFYFSKIFKKLN